MLDSFLIGSVLRKIAFSFGDVGTILLLCVAFLSVNILQGEITVICLLICFVCRDCNQKALAFGCKGFLL